MKKTSLLLLAALLSFFVNAQTFDPCQVVQVSDGDFAKVGVASHLGNNLYRLTPNTRYTFGGIWYQNKMNLNNDFYLEFELYFGTKDGSGADGMAFVLQPLNTNQGGNGGNLGFGGIQPSVGVEYDDWRNSNFADPSADHIAILKNGSVHHATAHLDPAVGYYTVANMEDGTYHHTAIEWIASSKTLNVYYEGTLVRTVTQDITNTIFSGNPDVFWGWTGATGAAYNNQYVRVLDVQFSEAIELDAVVTEADCVDENGAIDLSILPVDAYSIAWDNGSATEDLSNLSSGSYAVTVTNNRGCSETESFVLTKEIDTEAPQLICSSQVIDIDVNGLASLDLNIIPVSDNCELDTVFAEAITFDCEQIGWVETVLVTAYDVSGNMATCNVEVTVEDNDGNCDNCYKGTPVSPVACADCDNIVPASGWAHLNAGDTACVVTKNNGGINMQNGSTLIVCGNVILQGLNIPENGTVIINGTLNVNHLNFNGNNCRLLNYGTLNVNNGFNLRGSYTNYGIMNVGQTININNPSALFENNGEVYVGHSFNANSQVINSGYLGVDNNFHVNGNASLLNNCTILVGNRFIVNAGTAFVNDGIVEVDDKAIFNNAQFVVHEKSVISADGGNFNNSTAQNPDAGCAFFEIADRSQFNQPTFDGAIAYCDQNTVIEIDNNSVFTNGASLSCTSCGGSSPVVATAFNLGVQPNPVSNGDFITATYNNGNYYLTVTDIYGTQREARNVSQSSSTIQIANYPLGIYILQIVDNNGNVESLQFEVE